MKIKAIQDYRDIITDADVHTGDTFEVEDTRANELIEKGLVEKATIISRKKN